MVISVPPGSPAGQPDQPPGLTMRAAAPPVVGAATFGSVLYQPLF
jgi:hypothetical protein